MVIDRLREHLEWHLRRMRAARAAAAQLSLRPGSDGLHWLTLTHVAVLALEATLAEGIAPDHQALEEVIADLSAAAATPAQAAAEATPEATAEPSAVTPPAPASDAPSAAARPWGAAVANLSALAFTWRAPRARQDDVGSAGQSYPPP